MRTRSHKTYKQVIRILRDSIVLVAALAGIVTALTELITNLMKLMHAIGLGGS